MAVNRERMMVLKEVTEIYFTSDTLDEAIAKLERLRESYGGDAIIQQRSSFGNDYLALMVMQAETDLEMKRRISREELNETVREEREREDFERLAKKYGKA